jgi:inosine-uridine nucleoside N-ribohydrolase
MMRLSLTLLFLFSSLAFAKTPVVLSTDVGNEIDDQWAIAHLLLSGKFDVRGILSAQAPTLPAPSARATYKILVDEVENRLGMREHPPLLEGASTPLTGLKSAQDSEAMRFLIEVSKDFNKDNRLVVLTIGAATEVASAIITDPSIVDRIEVVAMGFTNLSNSGGKEFNVENDPVAWRVILQSAVPVTIGSGDVCRQYLAMSFDKAAALLADTAIGGWLWQEYQERYFRFVKPERVNDFSKPSIIWDIITMAYVEGIAEHEKIARPVLGEDLSFEKGADAAKTVNWITTVDSAKLWTEFGTELKSYERTHAVNPQGCARN